MKHIRVIQAALAAVGLAVAGCSSTVAGSTHPDSTARTAPAQGVNHPSDSSVDDLPSDTPSPTPTDTGPAKFGERFAYEDGLAIKAAAPKPFTPSDYAAKDSAKLYVYFVVTIVNGTGQNYDPSMFSASVQSSNVEGSEVYDSENGFEGAPSTKLLPNREMKFKLGFGIQDIHDVVFDASPGYNADGTRQYDDAIFTTAGAG